MRTDTLPAPKAEVLVNDYVRSVYNWMGIGLALTGFVAYCVSTNEAMIRFIFGNTVVFFGLLIGQLALVFAISGMVQRMSAGTATFLFVLYSALTGVTLSFIFLVYARASIFSTFFICAGTFAACSIYGWTSKRDLTSLGGFLLRGLFGIIIATVVNLFLMLLRIFGQSRE